MVIKNLSKKLISNYSKIMELVEKEHTNFIEDVFLNSKDIYQETNNELLNYALHYARCGFPVIPLQDYHPLESLDKILFLAL